MKVLLIIGGIVGVLVLIGILLAIIAPREINVESAIIVDSPKEEVIDQVRYFNNYPNWSPWRDTDPEQKFRVEGTDGIPGVKFHWEGKEGSGYQTITSVKPNEVKIKCLIETPFKSQPDFVYTFEEVKNKTKVTQQFHTDMPVPANIFGLLFNLKEKIKTVNERGLAKLKKASETQKVVLAN